MVCFASLEGITRRFAYHGKSALSEIPDSGHVKAVMDVTESGIRSNLLADSEDTVGGNENGIHKRHAEGRTHSAVILHTNAPHTFIIVVFS